MAMMETEGAGEAAKNTEIRQWMEQNGIALSSATYNKLNQNGFTKITHLQQFSSAAEIMSLAKDAMGILLIDALKLKNAFAKFHIADSNKKHYVNIEESNSMKSMELQVSKLENVINNLITKETNIEKEKENIEQQIIETFTKLTTSLNERKSLLLNELNDIFNKKNELLKSKMIKLKNSMHNVTQIKYESDTLLQIPITIDGVQKRTLKIAENEKNITQIVNDVGDNNIGVGEKMCFVLDLKDAVTFMNGLGAVSEITVPILKQVVYDNNNPYGQIKVSWKIPSAKQGGDTKKKLHIEYANIENKNDDNKEVCDEKKWDSTQVDIAGNLLEGTYNIMVDTIGTYLFKVKYYSMKEKIYSAYSNIKSINVMTVDMFPETKIIDMSEKNILRQWMFENVVKNNKKQKIKLLLLYRMSRDGKDINIAHAKYLNKGATIMQSKDYNHVCGGYTSKSWKKPGGASPDPDAFIFLLRSQFGHNPQIFKPKDTQKAVHYNPDCGPSWGTGRALRIYPQSTFNAYSRPDDVYDIVGNSLLGGSSYSTTKKKYNYWLKDYEVYQVVIE